MNAKMLPLAIVGILAVPTLSAAAPCVNGTLQSYIDLGAAGCNVNYVRFTNFAYTYTIPGVPASKVQVQVFTATTTGAPPTLKFLGMWTAAAAQRVDAVVKYNVAFPLTVGPIAERGRLGLHLGPDKINGTTGSIDVVEKTEPGSLAVYDRRGPFFAKRDAILDFTPPSALKTSSTSVTILGGDAGATLTYFASAYSVVRVSTP